MVMTAKTKKVSKKATVHRRATSKRHSKTVDYYPNRMTFAVSLLAVSILLLLAAIVTVNQ